MTYRFKRIHRQFREGDLVPTTYDAGTIKTMLDYHIIEPTEEPEVKVVESPASKLYVGRGKRK
jgi:hypothetical protein